MSMFPHGARSNAAAAPVSRSLTSSRCARIPARLRSLEHATAARCMPCLKTRLKISAWGGRPAARDMVRLGRQLSTLRRIEMLKSVKITRRRSEIRQASLAKRSRPTTRPVL